MRRFKFKQLSILVERVGYGNYRVTGLYARKNVVRHTTESRQFDKLDSDNLTEVREGQRYFFNLLKENR